LPAKVPGGVYTNRHDRGRDLAIGPFDFRSLVKDDREGKFNANFSTALPRSGRGRPMVR
jgi:hypothetical protein